MSRKLAAGDLVLFKLDHGILKGAGVLGMVIPTTMVQGYAHTVLWFDNWKTSPECGPDLLRYRNQFLELQKTLGVTP